MNTRRGRSGCQWWKIRRDSEGIQEGNGINTPLGHYQDRVLVSFNFRTPDPKDLCLTPRAAIFPIPERAKPWVAANRPGRSLKGRDKLCNPWHFAAGLGKDYLTLAEAVAKGVERSKSRRVKE